ncbi:MAG: hypothetical protein FWD95_01810 [Nocardioidaceae bacterium]|nr:hypothetical protein [Nocardioidaceae bacterium]
MPAAKKTAAKPTAKKAAARPAKPKQPQPDAFGRLRVRDEDTGYDRTIAAHRLHLGHYTVLDEPASTPTGMPRPDDYHESLSSPSTDGQQAESKENHNG